VRPYVDGLISESREMQRCLAVLMGDTLDLYRRGSRVSHMRVALRA
jgi:hypothetical protein